jgi:hypothetical protein
MKLGDVANGMSAWERVVKLKVGPSIAFKLMKYAKKVDSEYIGVENARCNVITDIVGVEPGSEARLEQGTPEFVEYVKQLAELYEAESELPLFDMNLDEFVELVQVREENELSAIDLIALQPFFKDEEVDNGEETQA